MGEVVSLSFRMLWWRHKILITYLVVVTIVLIAVAIRAEQTRDRQVNVICRAENLRWSAYLSSVKAISEKRRPGEGDEEYQARKSQTEGLINKIQGSVVLHC